MPAARWRSAARRSSGSGSSRRASRRLLVLAALLVAGALATYRLGFAPYLAALLALVVATTLVTGPDRGIVARRAGVFAGATAFLALPSLIALGSGLPEFVDAGGFSTAFKEHFPAGQPGEALGLVPRVGRSRRTGRPRSASPGSWTGSLVVQSLGLARRGRRCTGRRDRQLGRADFLSRRLERSVLRRLARPAPPRRSRRTCRTQLLAYGAPFLVCLPARAVRRGRRTRATVAAAACRRRAARRHPRVVADESRPWMRVGRSSSSVNVRAGAQRCPRLHDRTDSLGGRRGRSTACGTSQPLGGDARRTSSPSRARRERDDGAAYRHRPVTHIGRPARRPDTWSRRRPAKPSRMRREAPKGPSVRRAG